MIQPSGTSGPDSVVGGGAGGDAEDDDGPGEQSPKSNKHPSLFKTSSQ